MPDNPTQAVETMLDRLHEGRYGIPEADRDVLFELSDTIRLFGPSEYNDYRHEFLLRHGLKIAKETGQLAAGIENCDVAEDVSVGLTPNRMGVRRPTRTTGSPSVVSGRLSLMVTPCPRASSGFQVAIRRRHSTAEA